MRRESHTRNSEAGQATTEFALILFPFLILVAAIIQFGIGISFWQDQQRLAAQGARIAITNCQTSPAWCTPTLEDYLEAAPLSNGNRPQATVCFTSRSGGTTMAPRAAPGDGVRVELTTPFTFVPILNLFTIDLTARTTMRMEQQATNPGIAAQPECT